MDYEEDLNDYEIAVIEAEPEEIIDLVAHNAALTRSSYTPEQLEQKREVEE